jgi:hypothetical protein
MLARKRLPVIWAAPGGSIASVTAQRQLTEMQTTNLFLLPQILSPRK